MAQMSWDACTHCTLGLAAASSTLLKAPCIGCLSPCGMLLACLNTLVTWPGEVGDQWEEEGREDGKNLSSRKRHHGILRMGLFLPACLPDLFSCALQTPFACLYLPPSGRKEGWPGGSGNIDIRHCYYGIPLFPSTTHSFLFSPNIILYIPFPLLLFIIWIIIIIPRQFISLPRATPALLPAHTLCHLLHTYTHTHHGLLHTPHTHCTPCLPSTTTPSRTRTTCSLFSFTPVFCLVSLLPVTCGFLWFCTAHTPPPYCRAHTARAGYAHTAQPRTARYRAHAVCLYFLPALHTFCLYAILLQLVHVLHYIHRAFPSSKPPHTPPHTPLFCLGSYHHVYYTLLYTVTFTPLFYLVLLTWFFVTTAVPSYVPTTHTVLFLYTHTVCSFYST